MLTRKSRNRYAIAFFVWCVSGTIASSATLTLTGTVRDFSDSHPDFEGAISGLQTGAVESELVDGKPVLTVSGAANKQFSTPENFSQWYRDVEGINQSSVYDITLNEVSEGGNLFEFSSSSFFPIDDQLLGNEGRNHNYHFTYEIAGSVSFRSSDRFEFTGDDDVWIFVDGKLAVDLGGVHGPASSAFTGHDLIDDLGLKENTNYDFNLFFAERHTTQSNFGITSSFAIEPQEPPAIPLPGSMTLIIGALSFLVFLQRMGNKFGGWACAVRSKLDVIFWRPVLSVLSSPPNEIPTWSLCRIEEGQSLVEVQLTAP